MPWTFPEIVQSFLEREEWITLLSQSLHGIEREVLRITPNGDIAQSPHPKSLGSALTHPFITTDFSEAQLECVTPTFETEKEATDFLHQLHRMIHRHLPEEFLWPFSTPCPLPEQESDIPIAQYGDSPEGRYRYLYRRGLVQRYGARMQTLSGIHYNFSFHPNVWKGLQEVFQPEEDLVHWKSKIYLHIIRNFLRMGWLNTYLFGATPLIHKSYLYGYEVPDWLEPLGDDCYYGPYATSLRMSPLGYFAKVQQQHAVSLNTLDEYIDSLQKALDTPHPLFSQQLTDEKGEALQLNGNVLQNTAEHYARIRPKPLLKKDLSPLHCLKDQGIAYLEIRTVDISPFEVDGFRLNQLYFLHTFLLYCLFKESPPMQRSEHKIIRHNQNLVAMQGRDPHLQLEKEGGTLAFRDAAAQILDEMQEVAQLLDKAHATEAYTQGLYEQRQKLENPSLLPSEMTLEAVKGESGGYLELGKRLARAHKAHFDREDLPMEQLKEFAHTAALSLAEQEKLWYQASSNSYNG